MDLDLVNQKEQFSTEEALRTFSTENMEEKDKLVMGKFILPDL